MGLLLPIIMAGSAVLLASAPAQAAPKDPVKAVKEHLVTGHGVRFSETIKQVVDGTSSLLVRRSGTLQFGKSKVVASDITDTFASGKGNNPSGRSRSAAPPGHWAASPGQACPRARPDTSSRAPSSAAPSPRW